MRLNAKRYSTLAFTMTIILSATRSTAYYFSTLFTTLKHTPPSFTNSYVSIAVHVIIVQNDLSIEA
ncbi:hypothetical protein V1477_008715 [Vespula maculifrons]|uniref:Secreted protein n=1 Tax=Vespula maculifrons TaxID=7453 RepID=A0ABD2CDU0_VESMC